jgi:hypothetical protein
MPVFVVGIFVSSKKSPSPMEVICIEDTAFYVLIDKVVEHIKTKHEVKGDKWIGSEEAMRRLNITSRTTLQKFRDEGKIRYTQPEKKIILYDADSIEEHLEKHAQERF